MQDLLRALCNSCLQFFVLCMNAAQFYFKFLTKFTTYTTNQATYTTPQEILDGWILFFTTGQSIYLTFHYALQTGFLKSEVTR